jgi:integrase/recombinase XerD
MSNPTAFATLLERFFIERLIQQRHASPHTIASYRDTFRLLFEFAHRTLHKPPSRLDLRDVDAVFVGNFLNDIECQRTNAARTRNLRLTAIRSFCRFAAPHEPAHAAHFQRILAIPQKRCVRPEISFVTREEMIALVAAPDRNTWIGRRDHALLLLASQTGLRLSEVTSLNTQAIVLGVGASVRCIGKGRKERRTPLAKQTAAVMKAWLKEPPRKNNDVLFPSINGGRLSADAVQHLVRKYVGATRQTCPSLKHKRVSPHTLRHGAAMELLQAGVDSTVIALWLGHESVETTQVYIHAHLALKEAALAKTNPLDSKPGRFRATDRLLEFLSRL